MFGMCSSEIESQSISEASTKLASKLLHLCFYFPYLTFDFWISWGFTYFKHSESGCRDCLTLLIKFTITINMKLGWPLWSVVVSFFPFLDHKQLFTLKGKSKTDKTNSHYVPSIQEEHFLTRKSNLLYLVHSRRIRNNYFISIKGKGKDKTSFSNVHTAQDEHLLRREPTNLHKK